MRPNFLVRTILAVAAVACASWLIVSLLPLEDVWSNRTGRSIRAFNREVGAWLLERSVPACGPGEAPPQIEQLADEPGATLFSWVGGDGVVHFTDDPALVPRERKASAQGPLPAIGVYRGSFSPIGERALRAKQARRLRTPATPSTGSAAKPGRALTAIVYSAEWCGACKQAKAFLASRGVAVEMRDIEKDPTALDELVSMAGENASIPVTVLGKTTLAGFDEAQFEKAIAAAAAK